MFDFDELEVAKPFTRNGRPPSSRSSSCASTGGRSSGAEEEKPCAYGAPEQGGNGSRVLYCVRLLLDAPPAEVAEAVAAALLRGQPGEVDDATHAGLFISPPAYAEEYLKEFGKPPQVAHLLVDEVAHIHAAAFQLGLRLLRAGERATPATAPDGRSGFYFMLQRVYLHSSPEQVERAEAMRLYGPPPESTVCAEEEAIAASPIGTGAAATAGRQDACFRRAFSVRVHAPFVGKTVDWARTCGRVASPPCAERDASLAYRCVVQAAPVAGSDRPRTELRRELLETPLFRIGGTYPAVLAPEEAERLRLGEDKAMKEVFYMLEEEARVWARCHGFGLVEVWRGVRYDEVNKALALARFISTVYSFTPGEGAAAECEQTAGPCFNVLYAKRLAARFRRKRYAGVHGGAPGVAAFDGGQFTDGSVSIRGFAYALDRVCRRAAPEADIFRSFVDLGAGRGNAVIAAHALFPFRSCMGVEILAEHVDYSRQHARKYRESEDFYMSAHSQVHPEELFVHGDFLKDVDWSHASVVFCNAVTWPRQLIREVALLALRLRPGAVFLLLGFGKFFPAEPEVLNAFDFHSDACLVSWVDEPQGIWVYQRR